MPPAPVYSVETHQPATGEDHALKHHPTQTHRGSKPVYFDEHHLLPLTHAQRTLSITVEWWALLEVNSSSIRTPRHIWADVTKS